MDKSEFYSTLGEGIALQHATSAPTPCYIYFRDIIRKRFADLQNCLPKTFHVHYALKANPHPAIVTELAALGVGADVASGGELRRAISCGIKASCIEFSGPGKSEKDISEAIQHGISSINVESVAELDAIVEASGRLRTAAKVGLRINPQGTGNTAGLSMSGDTQFGIPPGQIGEALAFIKSHPQFLSFTGLHVHSGSQVLSSAALLKNFRTILDLSLAVAEMDVLPLRKINFGGGWGIKYFSNQAGLNLIELKQGLADLFADRKYSRLSDISHIVEPGRFLVGECGIYVTTVTYLKPGQNKVFAVVDGGMHQNYMLAGGMGQVVRRNFEMDVIASGQEKNQVPKIYEIAGCLCTPQDVLATAFTTDRELRVGDRIVFFNTGAYGLTASPINFLSHEPPSELIV